MTKDLVQELYYDSEFYSCSSEEEGSEMKVPSTTSCQTRDLPTLIQMIQQNYPSLSLVLYHFVVPSFKDFYRI